MTGSRPNSITCQARAAQGIAKKIEAARAEGDLSENGGYHAAKDEQGQIEARILTLQHILESARIGSPPRTHGVVGLGMTVTVRFVEDDEEITFLLASREESNSLINVYSPRSPLGAAINGKRVGERLPTRCRTAGPAPSRSSKPFPTRDPRTTAGFGDRPLNPRPIVLHIGRTGIVRQSRGGHLSDRCTGRRRSE